MKGNDLIIEAVMNGQNVIYAAKSCEVDAEVDITEVASPNTSEWKEYITGRKGWTVQVSYLVGDTAVMDDLLRIGNKVNISCKVRNGEKTLSGYAIVRRCHVTGTRGNLARGSFTFAGTGALE